MRCRKSSAIHQAEGDVNKGVRATKSIDLDTTQPATRKRLYRAIRALPAGTYAVDLIRKRWRVGDGQRGYYWSYLVVEVGRLIRMDRDKTDKVLNALFLCEQCEIAGQVVTVVRSLSDLDPPGAAQYFDEIAAWVYNNYRVRLTPPDPAKRKH
ncbi:hypothetical protein [Spirosoma foliorum]|uniref:Uncharacterized protein n=1 Tax=Spirosoma foliorum TaxID=2710596 RepID=A0A7G5GTV3_9BACT|nr:hypothetical protein [Spirosoma foliorum]QMW02295.1 hypothetical protein H3H32_30960 [Spirosoma foliorum]